jgi:beta-mannosidase
VDAAISSTTRPDRELVRAEVSGQTADWFHLRDHELSYPSAEYHVDTRPAPDGWEVEVVAVSLLRDVCLFPDRLDPTASVDRMLVTLLPGERALFRVTAADLSPTDLVRSPVLRFANLHPSRKESR